MGLVSGLAEGFGAGLYAGLGFDAGRPILEPVIGLRLSMLPLRFEWEGVEGLASSPRASALGATDAKPRKRTRKVGSSFMRKRGWGLVIGGFRCRTDKAKSLVRESLAISDALTGAPEEGAAALSGELLARRECFPVASRSR